MYGLEGTKYGTSVAEIINDVQKGYISQPTDLNTVFIMANTRVVVSQGRGKIQGATFSAIEEHTNYERLSEMPRSTQEGSSAKQKSSNRCKFRSKTKF